MGKDSQRIVSPPPLQRELADRISTQREVVTRELAALARKGIVEKTRGGLVIADPDKPVQQGRFFQSVMLQGQQTGQLRDTEVSLKQAFAGDFLVGAVVSKAQIMGADPAAMSLLLRQFSAITPENAMKWENIHPQENRYDWKVADTLVRLSQDNGLYLSGHVLVWHQQTPGWVFEDAEGSPASRELLLARMEAHIGTVVGRYRGRIQSWEVVNEALNEDGTLRETPWRAIIGDDYIARAFEFAHRADPEAVLYYNDFNLYKPQKRAGAVTLVRQLLERDVPIALGAALKNGPGGQGLARGAGRGLTGSLASV
jgi:GH35 family endo-1,4-beta-xylanase